MILTKKYQKNCKRMSKKCLYYVECRGIMYLFQGDRPVQGRRCIILRERLTEEQLKKVKDIMEENSPQRKVDDIVEKTKLAMEICTVEGQQAKVDKIVSEELAK